MNNLNLNLEVPLLLTILALLLFVYLSAQKSTFKAICYFLLAGAIILLLFGCGTQRYCQPSKRSKDYARSWWQERSDGYWVHYRQEGFRQRTSYVFECKQTNEQLNRFYDSVGKAKF